MTTKYESDFFCGFPVRLIPTTAFSMSKIFTKSNVFSFSNEFSKSDLFNEYSKFTESSLFIESIKNSQNTVFYSNQKEYSLTLTLSLTFVQRRSVSFSLSILKSNSYYINMITQSDYQIYIPYIIYYYSPTYVIIDMNLYIGRRKGLTGEQLIGITCGSAAVFFIILYIIILINWKKIYNVDFTIKWYKVICSSSSSSSGMPKEYQQIQIKTHEEYSKSMDDDSDLDFWL